MPLFTSAGSDAGAQTADAADIAVDHLRANAAAFGLAAADVSDVVVEDDVASGHTGVTHVYIQQRHQAIPVANGIVNVNVARDGAVLSAGNRFVADIAAATAGQSPAPATTSRSSSTCWRTVVSARTASRRSPSRSTARRRHPWVRPGSGPAPGPSRPLPVHAPY